MRTAVVTGGHLPTAATRNDSYARETEWSAKQEQPGEGSLTEKPEPWESWETALVWWSIGIGLAGLIVLGWLVDRFILS